MRDSGRTLLASLSVIRERVIEARTIADLADSEKVESMHIAEVISHRNLDRGDWAERGI